ncbi:MAG: hypothetical protein JXX14_02640 [Deltaproteobacteria bacterium]|nr:hypothetical protein [Deltaproteobacteria bacterium]
MGFQQGFANDSLMMYRSGLCVDPRPFAREPVLFQYSLANPPLVETWGQGLWVFHNPNCNYPLETHAFPDTTDYRYENGRIVAYHSGWQPITSSTTKVSFPGTEASPASIGSFHSEINVETIPKAIAYSMIGDVDIDLPPMEERGWFGDTSSAFLGMICEDNQTNIWGAAILARDEFFEFHVIETHLNFPNRNHAWINLTTKIFQYLLKPQRIFPR